MACIKHNKLTWLTYQTALKTKDGSTVRYVGTVRYASIFAKKYGTLVRYAFFVMVRVRYAVYASKIEMKYGTLVRYGSKWKVRSTQILNVPYRTAILAQDSAV